MKKEYKSPQIICNQERGILPVAAAVALGVAAGHMVGGRKMSFMIPIKLKLSPVQKLHDTSCHA